MALGFKIADGYVEVHADYDKSELRRAAQQAADGFGDGMDRGVTRAAVGRRIAEAIDRDVVKHRSRFQAAGRRIATHVRDGLVGSAAMGRNFIEAITFGQADFGRINTKGIGRAFAAAGTTLGVVMATALVAEIANMITALLPLALAGAFLALPVIHLLKTKDFKADIKTLKADWKSFITFVSEPVKVPLHQAFKDLGTFLTQLKVPFREILAAIAPAAGGVFKGFLDGIVGFVNALRPSLPGFVAGLQAWARELPKILTGLGQLFAVLMRDPQLVARAIQVFSQSLQLLMGFLGFIIPLLTRFASFLHVVGNGLNQGAMIARAFAAAWQWMTQQVSAAWASLKANMALVGADIQRVWNAVVAFFQSIPGRVSSALSTLRQTIIIPFQNAFDSVRAKVEAWVAAVVAFFRSLPGKAKAALSSLWSSISGAFTTATTRAKAAATSLVNGVINFLRTLPGKARSAVSALWSSMASTFSTAVSRARAAAVSLVNGFITFLRTIVSKARAAVSGVKGAITGAFSGAASWLVGAGRSIINGLANGIRSAVSGAVAAAASAARAALNAAKAAIGVSSPSKAFAEEVGVPAAQGIAVGLREQFPEEMKGLRKSLPQLRLPEPAMAGAMAGGAGGGGFSPTINLYMQPGFYSENAAAKRALTQDVWLALQAYEKDYKR